MTFLLRKMNKFVFMVPLPVLVFEDLATVDFSKVWDVKFVLFCFIVTLISITISFLISCLLGDKRSVENLFRQLTEAVLLFLESHLSKTFMEMPEWLL